jgi:hypothetical protein
MEQYFAYENGGKGKTSIPANQYAASRGQCDEACPGRTSS